MFPARAPFGVPYFHPPCNEAALPFGFALDGYQAKAELQRAERRREWLKRPMLLPPGSAEFNERESLALRLRLAAVSHEPMAKVGAEIALLEFDHGQRKRRHAEEQRALAASAAESEQRERQAAATGGCWSSKFRHFGESGAQRRGSSHACGTRWNSAAYTPPTSCRSALAKSRRT